MPKEDGSTLTIQMLRPNERVDSQLSFVIDEAAESSHHAPRDEAKREQTANIENHRRDETASQIASSETSPITATSVICQSGSSAMPHYAERDGDLVAAPLSPLRPVFRDILFTSLAAEEAGVELVGMTVQMDLPELGLTGEAIVTDIQPCPKIEPRSGTSDIRRVVTATFHHSSGDVIDLVLADERSRHTQSSRHTPCDDARREQTPKTDSLRRDESACQSAFAAQSLVTAESVLEQSRSSAMPHHSESDGDFVDSIGTTSNHPFWSVDRQEYVQAGQLEIGERLQTLHGHTKTVVSNLPRPGPKTDVYNLEVHAEHVYFVGEDGVLVHNAYSDFRARVLAAAPNATEGKMQYAATLLRRASGGGQAATRYRRYMARSFGLSGQDLRQATNAFRKAGHGNAGTSSAAQLGYYIEAVNGSYAGTIMKVGVVQKSRGVMQRFIEQVANVVALARSNGLKGLNAADLVPRQVQSIGAAANARMRIVNWEATRARWLIQRGNTLPGHKTPR